MSSLLSDTAQRQDTVNVARQIVYGALSLAFRDPQPRLRGRLECDLGHRGLFDEAGFQAAVDLLREQSEPVAELAAGERPVEELAAEALLQRLPRSWDAWNAEYTSAFGLVAAGNCPPYETEYIHARYDFQRSQHLADVVGFYRAFGLAPVDEWPERPDHLALELEFMARLVALERHALLSSPADEQRATICRDAQATFLRDHLAWWIPTFARLVEQERPDGLHAAAARLLTAFLPGERVRLGVRAAKKAAPPTTIEPPEECDGCPLAT